MEVQFWEEGVDGQLVAPTRNRYAQRLPRGSATVTTSVDGLDVRTLPLMAVPTVHECTFPVDVVVTWVDGIPQGVDALAEDPDDGPEAPEGEAAAG